MTRPPREDYVRVSIEYGGFTAEPAVEYRDGDAFDDVAIELESIAKDMIHEDADAMKNARRVGGGIAMQWPDRAYFVEIWGDGKRSFAQVFQPFGLPRDQT